MAESISEAAEVAKQATAAVAEAYQAKRKHREADRKASIKSNKEKKIVEQWYEIRPTQKAGHGKILEISLMENGTKYSNFVGFEHKHKDFLAKAKKEGKLK